MSVSTSVTQVEYEGNESTVTAYVIPFPFLDTAHIFAAVSEGGTAPAVDLDPSAFTVTRNADGQGGTLVTEDAVDEEDTIRIYRYMPLEQPQDYQAAGPFPSHETETALDRLAMQIQQVNLRIARLDGDTEEQYRRPPGGGAVVTKDVQVFTNAEQRGAAQPAWVGQLGVQLDDSSFWKADSLAPGDWVLQLDPWKLERRIYEEGVTVPLTLTEKQFGYLSEPTIVKKLAVASLGGTADTIQVNLLMDGGLVATAEIQDSDGYGEAAASDDTLWPVGTRVSVTVIATGSRAGLDVTVHCHNV